MRRFPTDATGAVITTRTTGNTGRHTWLSRNLVILTLVSLTQDAASELLYPLLPLLLTGVLAAPPVVVGLIEGVADATAGITRYIAGRWSDSRGRKPFILAGYGFAALGKLLVAAAGAWPLVLAGRVVDRFGKGVRSAPRDALIASSVPKDALGRAFGFHRAGDTAGAIVGPLLGLAALQAMEGNLRAALWWAAVPALASAALVFLVHEPRPRVAPTAPRRRSRIAPSNSPLPRRFWLVAGILVAIAVVNFSDALVLLRLMDLGMSTTEVVLAYVLFNTVYTLGAYPAGLLTDRWPRPYVYAAGLLAFGLCYIGLALTERNPIVYLLLAFYGLFPAFTDGVGKAWVSSLVPAEHRGRAQGVFQGLNSGAILIAGLWAGLLWNAGPGAGTLPLLISGSLGLLATVLLVLSRYRLAHNQRLNTWLLATEERRST